MIDRLEEHFDSETYGRPLVYALPRQRRRWPLVLAAGFAAITAGATSCVLSRPADAGPAPMIERVVVTACLATGTERRCWPEAAIYARPQAPREAPMPVARPEGGW